MSRTVLQIPMSPTLRKEAEKEALRQGFSSLQDAVRIFLSKLARRVVRVTFEEEEALSPKAIKRYEKMVDDIKKGKVKTKSFSDVDSMMAYLNE